MSDEREDEKKEPKVLAEVLRLEIVSPDPTSLLAAGHAVAESEARGERRGRNSPGELRLFGHFRVLYRDVDPVDLP